MYQYRVLPCPNFSIGDREIITRYGFLTYPYFIDNGFKQGGGLHWKKALQNAELFHPIFFIANDLEPLKDLERLQQICGNIIYPLHKKADLEQYIDQFEWIGFPNNPRLRDFKIQWFIDNTPNKSRWWLGVHDYPVESPHYFLDFAGFDTTLPEMYAGKYGKIWRGWRDYSSAKNRYHWRVLLEQNISNLKQFLDKLQSQSPGLEQFL